MAGTDKKEKRPGHCWLNGDELERLTETWAIWAENAGSPVRAVARARLHLFFLLARFGGLRSSEISAFPDKANFDRQTGLLHLKDRKLILPLAAVRPMRRILSLPQSEKPDFLRLDAGFLRRTFYEIGRLANLPPDSCAPRALRYARALELLEMHISPRLVCASLGIENPMLLERLLPQKNSGSAPNCFAAILAQMQAGYRTARLLLETREGMMIKAIISLEKLAAIEPAIGKTLSLTIPPGMIIPSDSPLPVANRLRCLLLSMTMDGVETRLRFRVKGGPELFAALDAGFSEMPGLRKNSEIDVYIPAHAVKLAAPQ